MLVFTVSPRARHNMASLDSDFCVCDSAIFLTTRTRGVDPESSSFFVTMPDDGHYFPVFNKTICGQDFDNFCYLPGVEYYYLHLYSIYR